MPLKLFNTSRLFICWTLRVHLSHIDANGHAMPNLAESIPFERILRDFNVEFHSE